MAAGVAIGALWLALCIDLLLGEPSARWHPVVWMGRALAWAGRGIAPFVAQASPSAVSSGHSFVLGALAWCIGACCVALIAVGLERVTRMLPSVVAALLLGILLKPMLAWRMLRDEVAAVEAALAESVEAGRVQLGRLVSRDVDRLDAVQVRESAIESLAENLNDSLVAPLFWFVLLGLPGAAVYRWANTADAMWGYRGERDGRDWTWAGKFAARADDVLSWVPARLTGLLIAIVADPYRTGVAEGAGMRARRDGRVRFSWRRWLREAPSTPSPNSGWPMAAMALRLGVRLGKPAVYVLNAEGSLAEAHDTARALSLAARGVLAAGMAGTLVLALGALATARSGTALWVGIRQYW